MISISLATGVTAMWLVSLPVDQVLHHPPTDLTVAKTAEATQERLEREPNAEIDASIAAVTARRTQEEFEQARNAEIDASIAAVAARRTQEAFEQARNAEIDVSIAAITIPWALTFADMQVGSFAPVEVFLEYPWQP